MFSFFNYHALFFLFMAVAAVPLLFPLFIRKETAEKASVYFFWVMLACFIYSFAYVLELMVIPKAGKIVLIKIQYLGAVAFAPLVYLFTLVYTGMEKWITRKRQIALMVLPLLNLILVWTTDWHHLFYQNFSLSSENLFPVLVTQKGLFYWIHQGYTLLLLFISLWLLIKRISEIPSASSRQVFMVILGLCSPLIVYMWYLTGNVPLLLDPIPIGFLGTGLFFFLGLKKFNLFRIAPVAYRTLFDNLQEGVMVLDNQGELVTLNLSAAKYIGIGKVHQKSALVEIKENWPEIADLLSPPEAYQIREFTRTRETHTCWYLLSKSTVAVEGKDRVGSLLVLRDITQERSSQLEIEKARIVAEEANKAKSEFLANMSHEIRTPLNGVIGFTELLTHTQLNAQQKRYAQTALSSASALLELINDILDLAKIEAGKADLNLGTVDLHALLETIIDVLSFQAHQKGLELILDLEANVPFKIETDELKLKQVLINLLNNGLKFTDKGEVILRVSWQGKGSGNNKGRLRFAVKDSGVGIAEDKQQLIFEAFSQADSSTTKEFGGTGLGLTISNKLLSLMESRIYLESELGKGSTFFFDLEVKIQENRSQEVVIKDISKVLVLDGNFFSGNVIARYCEDFGLKTVRFEAVNEAFFALENDPDIDVVLMNNRLMGNNSPAAMQQMIRLSEKYGRKVTFVAMIGGSDKDSLIQSYKEIGCSLILDKPVTPSKLKQLISKVPNPENDTLDSVLQSRENSPAYGKRFKLLVAEDNPINRMLVKIFLEKMSPGALVLEAENGREALSIFLEQNPDLVITDLNMPEMNGYELLQAIRELPFAKEVPVIGFTANAFSKRATSGKPYEFDDYLIKPVVQKKFQQVVGKWMSNPSST
ncbi:histidine kinase N-terminal 7TM domain-containing protein [Cyclobacterium jeungdonense]|uniref:histidine kinase n=1 Tax=Cyclobacterium jeungdonense TaxID=708087 RepID=A0ABT8C7Q3_9BACT|nr:histidine kinase N-terminal 7TM domain-containing protein [Cyclobacterium jeungdonense]MDN3688789.1 histidine kinase N-terminal 7TM domain-containing protein [Cyclobacterium jeungdonense]